MAFDYTRPEYRYIETFTGKKFFFDEPSDDMICIEDIAHSLANTCRYGGHCRKFYSVAEHSILLCMAYVWGNVEAYALLMHDAAEAYLTDLPRPIKYTMPEFRSLEAKIERAISRKFSLEYPHLEIVKSWDARAIVDERAQAMSNSGHDWDLSDLHPIGLNLQFWTPKQAEDIFLQHYHRLSGAVKAA